MPDIDSISQSFSPSRVYNNGTHSPSRHSPSRHASNSSLAAAATINAGFQNEESRRSSISSNRGRPSPQASRSERERRRSNAFLTSYDPTLPGPGELQVGDLRSQSIQGTNLPFRSGSPQAIGIPIMGGQRDRAPSLGELHQELEAEQEAQVNRLLEMIRHQQAQLQAMQQQGSSTPLSSSTALNDTPPPSERSANYPYPSMDLSQQSSRRSRTPSRTASPSLRPVSAGLQGPGEDWSFAGRAQSGFDDSTFYQAETQMLTRENQMLRQRIRELERQLGESNSANANSPITPSNLTATPLEVDSTEAVSRSDASTSEDKEHQETA